MNEIKEVMIEKIIYEIRGVQVMLDSDLAIQYKCANGTKDINKAVKRNLEKFPSDFYFQITDDEYQKLKFQIGTSNYNKHGGVRKLPHVFTEQGVAMLATVIHTKEAAKVSINIMRAFVKMRHFIMENKDVYKSINNINNKIIEHDEKFDYLFSKFDKKEKLFLEGETFNAYYNILTILEGANIEIIIIDNYADVTFLDLIRKIKVNITLITKDSNRLSNLEIDKYNSEYNNLKVIRNNSFHDRYIIIDKKEIYLIGSSINSVGNKISMIVKLEDNLIKEILLNNIVNLLDN